MFGPPPQVEEYADEVFDLLDNGAHMYFCGLKGMMPGILDMLKRVSEQKGRNFDEFVENLKHKNQWHVSSTAGPGGRAAAGNLCLQHSAVAPVMHAVASSTLLPTTRAPAKLWHVLQHDFAAESYS